MTKKEYARRARLSDVLTGLGFSVEDVESLRRISNTLHRWYERECNGDVERDEESGLTYYAREGRRFGRCADLERGAEKRLKKIMEPAPFGLGYYLQTDPRGAALYILRPGDIPKGERAESYYSRGICVY